MRTRLSFALLVLACGSAPPHPAPPDVPRAAPDPPPIPLAITLDDLPFLGGLRPGDQRSAAIDRIVRAARAHHAPLTGFVTCHNIADDSELAHWRGTDIQLENHSDAHRAIDDLGLDGWRDDLTRCQARISDLTGRAPLFYRYPFLRDGIDPTLRDASLAALADLGLRNAPVSIDTSDWALARVYSAALRANDAELAQRIADAYVAHVRAAARRYAARAARLGRPDAPQVLLLHANALAADHLGDVLAMLEAEHPNGARFAFVPLTTALADPIYARPESYAGEIGMSWLYRIEPNGARAWAWDAAQLHALDVRFGRDTERDAFDLDDGLAIRRIAPETWIVVDEEPWPANTLVAHMPDGTVVIASTPYTDAATDALLDWIRARFGEDAPIVAINAHFHPDGVGGNRALAAAGARTIGSTETARLVVERAGAMRAQMTAALADRPDQAALFAAYDPIPPAERFDAAQGLVLRFGSEEVHVIFPGPAHSPDNVVVHFPARRLVYGGCMIAARDTIGNVADADLEAWPRAIENVRALDPAILVPGHGDRTDPGLLDHTLELLRAR